jgi:hypothetical protein
MSDKKEKKEKQPEDILLGGSGLIQAILETMEQIAEAIKSGEASAKTVHKETPMDIIQDDDLDNGDPVVHEFLNDGGCKGVIRVIRFGDPKEAVDKLASMVQRLQKVRQAHRRTLLRQIFAAVQIARGIDNEAVRLERMACRMDSASRGFYQAEAVAAIDQLLLDTPDAKERSTLLAARNGILEGQDNSLDAAAFRLRALYASTLPKEQSIRIAYTTLRTQAGEPYLLCPKGKYIMGYPVPMEVSKCRENCIDSRMAADGSVSCHYQTWLKHADSHEKAMARLDVHRHPDNAANLLTLEAGTRANLWNEGDIPLEKRFEDSTQGANKLRDKTPANVSIEAQLEKAKPGRPGHRSDSATPLSEINNKVSTFNFRRRLTAQNDTHKTLEEQMPKGNTNSTRTMEEQIRAQADSNAHEMHETPREQQLDFTDSLNGRRGVMEKSYAHQLASEGKSAHSASEALNSQDEMNGARIAEKLSSTASKVVKLDAESEESLGAQIESKHSDHEYSDDTIEAMLADERVGLSEDEIDMLLNELLEQSRSSK